MSTVSGQLVTGTGKLEELLEEAEDMLSQMSISMDPEPAKQELQ